MNVKDLLSEDGFSCTHIACTYGGTYASPCPSCGGRDRFRCWPNQEGGGNWLCQKCGKKGGIVRYLTAFRGMSYQEACLCLGKVPHSKGVSLRKRRILLPDTWIPQPPQVPSAQWQTQAHILVKKAQECLWHEQYVNFRTWLHDRGLKEETIRTAKLGWNWTDLYHERAIWELPPKIKEDGTPSKLWIPAGLAIPYIKGDQIQRIRVRRPDPQDDYKYYLIQGSSSVSMVLGNRNAVIVVESELDAILIHQEVGDLVGVVALGSAQNRPDTVTTELLRKAETIIVALDSDEAGAKSAWRWWLKHFPNSKRWPTPFGKDPAEAYQQGLNLRDWVLVGLTGKEKNTTVTSGTSLKTSTPEYHLITDEDSLKDALSQLEKYQALVINIAATGPDPYLDKVRLIQLSAPDHPVVIIDLLKVGTQAIDLLKDLLKGAEVKVFHEAKSQLKFLHKAGLPVEGPLFDTLLASQLLRSGLTNKDEQTLDDLARDYLGEEVSKKKQAADWNEELTQDLLEDAARDISIIKRLVKVLISELKEVGLAEIAKLEFKCIPAVVEMELNGMLLNLDKWQALSSKLVKEKEHLELSLYGELGEINLDSPQQLLDALKSKGLTIENTKRATLGPLREHHTFIKDLEAYRKVAKLVGAFCHSIPKHIHPSTGRIHPDYRQIGAATGRFSCREPNLQQIPRARAFRGCFIPSPGFKMVIADYSQIELRVAAEISDDKRMIEAYREGQDLHRLTASLVMSKPIDQVTKRERQAAKAINFGLIYAMGAQSLQAYAQDTYGVDMTLKEAETFIERFFDAYQGLYYWHWRVKHSFTKDTRTLGGRRRIWQDRPPLTELLNTPVQGTAADIVKKALAMLPKELEGTGSRISSTVHDEIILEVLEDRDKGVAHILKKVMEEAGCYYLKKVPVEVEVSLANSWAEK